LAPNACKQRLKARSLDVLGASLKLAAQGGGNAGQTCIRMLLDHSGLSPLGICKNQYSHAFRIELLPTQNAIGPGVATYKAGTPVYVLVRMINDSNGVVHYSLTNPAFDYEVDVREVFGKPVSETERFREMKKNAKENANIAIVGRFVSCVLKPHKTGQDTIEVSDFYDLSIPGKYSVEIRGKFRDVSENFVISNRLEITVTP
jgi:hypothetical protein